MKQLDEMTTAELMVLCHKIANNKAVDEETKKEDPKHPSNLQSIGPPRSPATEKEEAAIRKRGVELLTKNLYLA